MNTSSTFFSSYSDNKKGYSIPDIREIVEEEIKDVDLNEGRVAQDQEIMKLPEKGITSSSFIKVKTTNLLSTKLWLSIDELFNPKKKKTLFNKPIFTRTTSYLHFQKIIKETNNDNLFKAFCDKSKQKYCDCNSVMEDFEATSSFVCFLQEESKGRSIELYEFLNAVEKFYSMTRLKEKGECIKMIDDRFLRADTYSKDQINLGKEDIGDYFNISNLYKEIVNQLQNLEEKGKDELDLKIKNANRESLQKVIENLETKLKIHLNHFKYHAIKTLNLAYFNTVSFDRFILSDHFKKYLLHKWETEKSK